MTSILAIIKKEWRAVAAMGAVTAVFMVFFYVKGLRADNARLRQENQIHQAAMVSLTEDLMANKRALEAREAESRKLAQDRQAALAELERVYSTDKEACDWAESKLPDSVRSALCGGGS
jgi:peroxiredoxin family protein